MRYIKKRITYYKSKRLWQHISIILLIILIYTNLPIEEDVYLKIPQKEIKNRQFKTEFKINKSNINNVLKYIKNNKMTKKKAVEDILPSGAPTKYKEEYNEQVYKLCLLGAKDTEIADFFEVCEATINNWKIDFPQFLESIRNGKTKADLEVANSLYKTTSDRIIKKQVPIKTKNIYWKDGKKVEEEEIQIVEVEETIPADFRSQSFWLRNRKSDAWREKSEVDSTVNNTITWNEEKTYLDGDNSK